MEKVSIVLPFKNRLLWLHEAVESVLKQTYETWELILVDDGSTDDVLSVVNFGDPRVRLIRQTSGGPGKARNRGIQESSGEYIAFLDSDDVFLPNKIEAQIAYFREVPGAVLCHTSYERFGETTGIIPSGRFSGTVYPRILLRCPIATPTVMLRKSLLWNSDRFPEHISIGEDIVMWAQIAQRSRIVGLDTPLTKVRIHNSNASTSTWSRILGRYHLIRYGSCKR